MYWMFRLRGGYKSVVKFTLGRASYVALRRYVQAVKGSRRRKGFDGPLISLRLMHFGRRPEVTKSLLLWFKQEQKELWLSSRK